MTRLYRYIDSVTGELKTTENTVSTITGNYFVEYFTLNASQIAAKKIVLTNTPGSAEETTISVSHGIDQDYNTDFIIENGNEVSWDSRGLETILEEGDKIKVAYII